MEGDDGGDWDASASEEIDEDDEEVSACAVSAEATMLCREAGYGAWGVWRAAATWELKASEGEVREAHAAVRAAAAERRVLTMVGLGSVAMAQLGQTDSKFDASFSGGYPKGGFGDFPLQTFKLREPAMRLLPCRWKSSPTLR